jgi:hypothetical protein
MSNPIKHVRETGEYVSIKPKPAVMGYRAILYHLIMRPFYIGSRHLWIRLEK